MAAWARPRPCGAPSPSDRPSPPSKLRTFITKAFQGTGIEGLVEAARDRFSNVQRFAPTASRNSSSETYLICRNKLPRVRKRGAGLTAMEQVSKHLAGLGILTGKQEVEEERAVGLRRISKKEEE